MNTVLCTLFEGHYHFGVAALANSLIAAGYRGEIIAGHRGALADWIVRSPDWSAARRTLRLTPQLDLRFVELDTPLFFAYYKPSFMRSVLREHAPQADAVAYIDPDIVVKSQWAEMASWFEGGIALCEDVNWSMPARHPKRLMWNAWFARHGHAPCRTHDRYYNSGFIGVPREHAAFLDLWIALCALVLEHNSGQRHIKAGEAHALFHSTDQDAMNFALTAFDAPLNTTGPEGMDFDRGGYYLSHAVGYKPWTGQHIRRALRGRAPTAPVKAYYDFANHPIRVYSPLRFALRRWSLGIGAAIGRFYRKA